MKITELWSNLPLFGEFSQAKIQSFQYESTKSGILCEAKKYFATGSSWTCKLSMLTNSN